MQLQNSLEYTATVQRLLLSVCVLFTIDASAMKSLHDLADRTKKKNITLIFSHITSQPMSVMEKDHVIEYVGPQSFKRNIVEALDYAEELLKSAK